MFSFAIIRDFKTLVTVYGPTDRLRIRCDLITTHANPSMFGVVCVRDGFTDSGRAARAADIAGNEIDKTTDRLECTEVLSLEEFVEIHG